MKRNSSGSTGLKIHIRKAKAFSLLELMISMALFGLGLLSMVSSLVEANSLLSSSGVKSKALMLASSRKEMQKVAELDSAALEYLDKRWSDNLANNIEGAESKVTMLSEKSASVNLFWTGNKNNASCNKLMKKQTEAEKEKPMDCLRL